MDRRSLLKLLAASAPAALLPTLADAASADWADVEEADADQLSVGFMYSPNQSPEFCPSQTGTKIKLFGIGELGWPMVRGLQRAGSRTISEFTYMHANEPMDRDAGTPKSMLEGQARAVGEADLLVIVTGPRTQLNVANAGAAAKLAKESSRLVVEIGIGPVTDGSPVTGRSRYHCVIPIPFHLRTFIPYITAIGADDAVVKCIRTLTDILGPGLIGTDFEDLCSVLEHSRLSKFAWGRGTGAEKGRMAALNALSDPALTLAFKAGLVTGMAATIHGRYPALKMREVSAVMQCVKSALGVDLPFACNTCCKDMPSDTIEVGLIATIATR